MKKFTIYIAVAAASLTLSSCEKQLDKWLDKSPFTEYDAKDVTTPEGIEGLLRGVYNNFQASGYYGMNLYCYEMSKGIDFFVRESSGGSFERECRYSESLSSPGSASGTWLQIYTAIRTATDLISKVPQVEGLDPESRDRILGEAHGLRGLAYFDLMRLFAWMPRFSIPGHQQHEEQYKWGVPILDDPDMAQHPDRYDLVRQTADSTYRYIRKEFELAHTLLNGKETGNGHINFTAVCGLMARMYLYLEDWDNAILYGEEALESAGKKYSLLSYDSYISNYWQSFNSESIWELAYSSTDNLGSGSINYVARKETYNIPGSDLDGTVSNMAGYAAFGLFSDAQKALKNTVNGVDDVRGYLVCELGVPTNPDYKGCRRYIGTPYHWVYNVPVIRLPEIMLTVAEAYLHKYDKTSAAKYYIPLRQARVQDGSGFGSADAEAALGQVLAERRRELIMEGHTYWDYFRRGATMTRPENLENVRRKTVRFGIDGTSYGRPQVIYPIPLGEMEANKAMRKQQSPGYGTYDDYYKSQQESDEITS